MKLTANLMTAQLFRKKQVQNQENHYLSENGIEEWTVTDDNVSNWFAHTVDKAQEKPILDQKFDQILELSAPVVLYSGCRLAVNTHARISGYICVEKR